MFRIYLPFHFRIVIGFKETRPKVLYAYIEKGTLSRKIPEGTLYNNREIMLFIFLYLTIWRIGAAFLPVLVVKSWMDGSIASYFI
jgi:hypothetical protein